MMLPLTLLIYFLLLFSIASAVFSNGEYGTGSHRMIVLSTIILLIETPNVFGLQPVLEKRKQSPARKHKRQTVMSIFNEMGPIYVCHAYWMEVDSFWKLHAILRPHLETEWSETKMHKDGAVNGLILTSVQLSVALRYFAIGSFYDISVVHGISHTKVFSSVWRVVDAVNSSENLTFHYPKCHKKQREIARKFMLKSKPGFECCAGAINGMLVWIECPSELECGTAQCGSSNFFCERKHKFGLNLQGTCDLEGCFLDVCIAHPASTSDYLSFSTSSLKNKLEMPGFLAEGLCIFGDNAYINCSYMATPYRNVASGSKDNYNHYHSQLHIQIECAFSMLVNRWGILQQALSTKLGLKKTTSLAMCLCQLHNYCIDSRLEAGEQ